MTYQAQDIVAILAESGVRTRRERAAFVAKLRDENNLSFGEIGRQLNVSDKRAHQLYNLHKIFQRSANSPFADLSTRARNFLNNLARSVGLPDNWEENPALIRKLVYSLGNTHRREAMKYRNLGATTMKEIEDFFRSKGVSFMEAQVGTPVDDAIQRITEFLNQSGFIGQFKMWPKGTYLGEAPDHDFTMTGSDFLGDAWQEKWQSFRELDMLVEDLGYRYSVSGEAGQQRTFHFFRG